MKALRVLTLVLALSTCTYAGNIPMGVVEPPPPAPGAAAQIETGDTDPITEIAVNLLQSVLSLF
jgi:hypothetical protein